MPKDAKGGDSEDETRKRTNKYISTENHGRYYLSEVERFKYLGTMDYFKYLGQIILTKDNDTRYEVPQTEFMSLEVYEDPLLRLTELLLSILMLAVT